MRRSLACALVLAPVLAFAQSSVTLKVRARVGAKNRYAIKWHMEPIGAKGRLEMATQTTETLSAVKGGRQVWKVETKVTKLVATGVMEEAKRSLQDIDGLVFSSFRDETGQVHKMEVNGISVPSKGTSNLVFPKGPVRVGSTWTAPIETSGRVFIVEYRLDALRRQKGRTLATVSGRYKPGQDIRSALPLMFQVDARKGVVLSGSGAFQATFNGVKLKGGFTLTRL